MILKGDDCRFDSSFELHILNLHHIRLFVFFRVNLVLLVEWVLQVHW